MEGILDEFIVNLGDDSDEEGEFQLLRAMSDGNETSNDRESSCQAQLF
jgi:hypothetical protein